MSYKAGLDKKNSSRLMFRYSIDNLYRSNDTSLKNTQEIQSPNKTHFKIRIDKSTDGLKKIINKYSSLKSSNINLNSLSEVT